MTLLWNDLFSAGAREMRGSAIRRVFREARKPGVISLTSGAPAPEVFPVEDIAAAAERALMHHTLDALQYTLTEGYAPLREFIAERMNAQGGRLSADRIIITAGSQQAIDLVGRLFIDPGTLVAIEDPTYMSALTALAPQRPRYLPIPMDQDGLIVDVLADALARGERPAFLYTITAFQNPTGVSMSMARREQLLDLAERYGLPIIEDDPYGELVFEGQPRTPLAMLDCMRHGELRHVIYLSTFSKLVSPGLRIAWVAAPPEVIAKMQFARQGMDLHASGLSQVVVHEVCADGLLDRHLPVIRNTYRERRDAMLRALDADMAGQATWTRPSGGMFIWMTLTEDIDADQLVKTAIEHGVAFVPGFPFYANGGPRNTLRLSFANPTPETITQGVSRLAVAVRHASSGMR